MILPPRVVVAGVCSGVGKTTVATGLMAAFTARGRRVAAFKVGPDFIDPSYHALATGRPARNLDAFLSGAELIPALFAHGAAGCDLAVVEGVMGLFDGATARGELASTAQLAKLLAAPVVLVVDAGAMARSIAALVHGYASFDPDLRVAGVVANRVGSPCHAELLREALDPLGIPLLGALLRDDALVTPSRHLGLVPVAERPAEARAAVAALGERFAAAVDLEAVDRLARGAQALACEPWAPPPASQPPARTAGVAVAGGPAFSFVYAENLELLSASGAELLPLDPTRDEALPAGADALYLGGGFPEAHAAALADNAALRAEVAAFAASGRPVVAECGGLLYLCATLDGRPMCGVLPAHARMAERLTLGYREALAGVASPAWPAGQRTRGHEFHYAAVDPPAGTTPAWRLEARGRSVDEGFVAGGVHASFLHTHWAATPAVAARLVAAASATRRGPAGGWGSAGGQWPAGGREPGRRRGPNRRRGAVA
jgi:cobyrinic acid a,c-diamide synthase